MKLHKPFTHIQKEIRSQQLFSSVLPYFVLKSYFIWSVTWPYLIVHKQALVSEIVACILDLVTLFRCLLREELRGKEVNTLKNCLLQRTDQIQKLRLQRSLLVQSIISSLKLIGDSHQNTKTEMKPIYFPIQRLDAKLLRHQNTSPVDPTVTQVLTAQTPILAQAKSPSHPD